MINIAAVGIFELEETYLTKLEWLDFCQIEKICLLDPAYLEKIPKYYELTNEDGLKLIV